MDGVTGQALAAAIGYGLGSIPFGLILAKLFGAGDIREIGSGSIGATNVLRTGRKGLAAATLLLDALKGFVAVLIAAWIAPGAVAFGAIGALIGHCYPVWLGFRGGKGIATCLGILLAVYWPVALAAGAVWLIVAAVFRISSLASLAAAVSTPLAGLVLGADTLVPVFAAMAILVLWKHKDNIRRLAAGAEPKIGKSQA